ncbi:RNA polymerase sigma factor [Tenacibaculum xiamenense]|uniref:RNA polymerase sigma factor n=1 Tax=Tenacibaculum xiamenense TaxID=1261553 RepID=UPI003894F074
MNREHINDTQLTLQIKKGNELAFRQLFNKYYQELVKRSYQLLKDEDEAKDTAQEVFVAFWNNRIKLPEKMEALPYLKRAVINRSLNRIKAKSRRKNVGEEALNYVGSTDDSPETFYEVNELEKIVYQAIDSMPEKCRQVFMLCRMEDFSHDQISQKLRISKKTIETQMRRALQIVKQAILKHKNLGLLIFAELLRVGMFLVVNI